MSFTTTEKTILAGAFLFSAATIPGAYHFGAYNQKAEASLQLSTIERSKAELDGKISQLQTELAKAQERLRVAEAQLAERTTYLQQTSQQAAQLQTKLSASSTCVFIHTQIKELNTEIDRVGNTGIWSPKDEVKDNETRQRLEARLARYQEQLGRANCT